MYQCSARPRRQAAGFKYVRLYAADQTHLLYAEVGLAEIARHVIDSHFEPSFPDLNGIICVVTSNICQGLSEIDRRVIGTHFEPSIIELNGML